MKTSQWRPDVMTHQSGDEYAVRVIGDLVYVAGGSRVEVGDCVLIRGKPHEVIEVGRTKHYDARLETVKIDTRVVDSRG